MPYRERPDISFVVDAAREAGSPVLEIGCGTGRVLIPSARAGVEVVGLDASPQMLAVCRQRLQQENVAVQSRVELVQADMRAFELERQFTLATLPFRPFQHLITVEEQRSSLMSIRRHLIERGRLVLDLFNPSLEALVSRQEGQEAGDEPEFSTPDGRRVVRRHRTVAHDRFNQVTHVELVYYVTHPDGREERLVHAFPMRYLFNPRQDVGDGHIPSRYDRAVFAAQLIAIHSGPAEDVCTASMAVQSCQGKRALEESAAKCLRPVPPGSS